MLQVLAWVVLPAHRQAVKAVCPHKPSPPGGIGQSWDHSRDPEQPWRGQEGQGHWKGTNDSTAALFLHIPGKDKGRRAWAKFCSQFPPIGTQSSLWEMAADLLGWVRENDRSLELSVVLPPPS